MHRRQMKLAKFTPLSYAAYKYTRRGWLVTILYIFEQFMNIYVDVCTNGWPRISFFKNIMRY